MCPTCKKVHLRTLKRKRAGKTGVFRWFEWLIVRFPENWKRKKKQSRTLFPATGCSSILGIKQQMLLDQVAYLSVATLILWWYVVIEIHAKLCFFMNKIFYSQLNFSSVFCLCKRHNVEDVTTDPQTLNDLKLPTKRVIENKRSHWTKSVPDTFQNTFLVKTVSDVTVTLAFQSQTVFIWKLL